MRNYRIACGALLLGASAGLSGHAVRRGKHRCADEAAIVHENRHNTSATVTLDWQGERSRALLFLGYQQLVIEGGRSILQLGDGLGAIPEPPDAATNYTSVWALSELETTFGMLRGSYDLNDNWASVFGGYLSQGEPRTFKVSATIDF